MQKIAFILRISQKKRRFIAQNKNFQKKRKKSVQKYANILQSRKIAVSLHQEKRQVLITTKNSNMKTLKELQNELVQLQTALAKKLVTPTEYGSIYYNISQQIKKIQA